MATIDIRVGQKVTLSIVPTLTTLAADLVGIPTWSTADATVTGLEPAEDGRSVVVTGKKVGSAVVTANAIGASALTANHTIAVAAATASLADAIAITVEKQPE